MEMKWLMIGLACMMVGSSAAISVAEFSKTQCRIELAKVPTRTAEDIVKICR